MAVIGGVGENKGLLWKDRGSSEGDISPTSSPKCRDIRLHL